MNTRDILSCKGNRYHLKVLIPVAIVAYLVMAIGGLDNTSRENEINMLRDKVTFSRIALEMEPVTDKVSVHHYETLYDKYFSDIDQPIKLLEIGLGCDMAYGPGASAQIWPQLFPTDSEIWFAELDEECVRNYWTSDLAWNYVTGDQGDPETVEKWIQITGGEFDFVIDDGGHTNTQIWTSFEKLFFKVLKPGGVYFLEDLHVGRYEGWYSNGLPHDNTSVVLDVLTDWMDQLVVKSMKGLGIEAVTRRYKHKLPPAILRIDCVGDMCAITKALQGGAVIS